MMAWIKCAALGAFWVAATLVQPAKAEESFADKIGSAWKNGVNTVTKPFKSNADIPSEPDPTMLTSPGEPSPESYVAMARFTEQTGKYALAADQYERALKLSSKYLPALLGYARLKDRQDDLVGALELYKAAAKAHPQDGAVPNDVGLCFARRGDYPKALDALEHAVKLNSSNARYRANIAAVLVDMDRPNDALIHLQAVRPPAIAHYNLAFLLNKKGKSEAAIYHFRKALELDPTLIDAQRLLAQLDPNQPSPSPESGEPSQTGSEAVAAGPSLVSEPGSARIAVGPALPGAVAGNREPSGQAARISKLPPPSDGDIRTARLPLGEPSQPAVLPPRTDRAELPPIAPLPPVETSIPRVRPLPPVE